MAVRTPTMKDVAHLAGVSVQTVSCVVNDTGSISPETRQRVLQAIEQLNYRRDPIARSMRTRQTRLIALLVLDITNPVLSVIASNVEAAAYAEDYNVLLYNVSQDVRREQAFLEAVAERRADGMIIVNAVDRQHTFALLEESTIPTVLVDCVETPALPSVAVNNFRGAYLATQHAIELGHRQIAHLCGALTLEVARQRADGYRQALADYGLHEPQLVTPLNDRWDYHSGYYATRKLLEGSPRPTAIFAAGDQMAIGAYRALAEAGLRVPDDMSVIGFDDIEAAQFTIPPLTTIRQPLDQIAGNAFRLLLDLLDGRQPETTSIILPPELIVRDSTGRLP
ncbi:MAG: LacI family DNA-binding transcriptional regulator [Chloroflexi bacterium]|nr:LacI family DNA-binding transcriptional regulator [Chloroflexota bacterium]